MGEGDDGGGGGWRMKGKRGYSLLCSWMTNFVFYRSSYESCSSYSACVITIKIQRMRAVNVLLFKFTTFVYQ